MRRIVVFVAVLASLAAPLFAQRTTGGVSGTVKDSTGSVLPGVVVSVSGPNIVGAQTATTNAQGFYRFVTLPPGEYEVSFSLAGFKTVSVRSLRVGLGVNIEQNASLDITQKQESVEVVAEAPVVDTTSNEVGANYDRTWVENAPLRRFSFLDLVAAAPGSQQVEDGSGRTMVYGSSYDENSFQLDGVDITDNYFNEYSATPNTDAIEEVEVLSLGAPAEYGNLTGAVYNIVTRQGTNEYHGDLNFFYQSDGLTSDNSSGLVNPDGTLLNECGDGSGNRCPWTRDRYHDFTAQLGGPIIKDKLWFFGSYQNQRDAYWDLGVPPENGGTKNVLGRKNFEYDTYLFKLNWQVSPKHKIQGTFHYDKRAEDLGIDIGYDPTTAWTRRTRTPTPSLAYTGVMSDKTVLDVRYSGFYGKVTGYPTDPNQPKDLPHLYNFDTGYISGGNYYWYEVEPKRTTVTAKVSHLADQFLGASHDFKFGVQYSDAVAQGIYGLNDAVYFYEYYGTVYSYGYSRQPFSYSGNSRNVGVFADDTIRVNDRLSVNLGVRYDYNKAYSAEQDELDENGQPTGTHFPRTDLYTWKTFSPRVGFNYKLTADGRTVLKGHYGRYHRAIATGEFANVIGPNVKPYFAGTNFDFATGTWGELTFLSDNTNLSVDPHYKSPYTDQFIASLERDIGKGVAATLNYVHKRGEDYPAWQETQGTYVLVPFTDDLEPNATGNTFNLFQLTSDPALRHFVITNPDGVGSRVNAASLNIVKRMTNNWQVNASATWLRSTGRLTDSVSGVTLQQRGGLQFRSFGKDPNDFVNTDGRLTGDVTWAFKLQAVYQLPHGFLVSANLVNHDGANIVRRATVSDVTQLPEGSTILLQKRGESGRLNDVTLLDMRVEKDFKINTRIRLSVFADFLNLLNNDTPEGVQSSIVTSSVYLYPFDPVDPRRAMLGAKLRF